MHEDPQLRQKPIHIEHRAVRSVVTASDNEFNLVAVVAILYRLYVLTFDRESIVRNSLTKRIRRAYRFQFFDDPTFMGSAAR
jgi:hypothetical protein